MGRGKLKYRDVMGGGGGGKKGKNNKKDSRKSQKSKPKARKTYSLYENKGNGKRKFNDHRQTDDSKRQKLETLPQPQIEESSSESEEELEDHMKQLRQTFNLNADKKKSLAIDSESSEEEDINAGDESDDFDEDETESTNQKNDTNAESEEKIDENVQIEEEIQLTNQENEEEQDDNDKDPFVKHLFHDLHENLLKPLQNTPIVYDQTVKNWPKLNRLIIQLPKHVEIPIEEKNEFAIAEDKKYALPGQIPLRADIKARPLDNFIKTQIVGNLAKANPVSFQQNKDELFTPLQNELFSIINNYQDLYFAERSFSNAEEIRFVYCLHAVNHILKTRMKVIHHNARLSGKEQVPEDFRDQGLVRPKILIVVPFKDAAYKIIQMLIKILLVEDKGNVINKKRFMDEYTGNEISMPKKNPKPEDYELTFSGNTSDDFKIGITVTKKSLKLFADFYSSDIIIASPLGLRTTIGAEGEPSRDYDFLASIELLILDQTELFLMQNWDHLLHFFAHLHLQPKESHGTDFSRVRTWSLNGWAKYYRQTLLFSALALPDINAIFNKKCCNYAGKVKVANVVDFGSIGQVLVQLPHVFHRFAAESVQSASDARFDFFVGKILPQQKDSLMRQTMVYVASYFDYVRLRNYFKREEVGFVQICEYSKVGKVARARDMFYHGDAHFLLYTERHHFYNRIRVKGIRHLVFYQPPNFPHFYYEICNLMQDSNMNSKIGNSNNMTVTVVYSKYDIQQLAAIVGTERAAKIAQSDRNVHMMLTGTD